MFEIVSIVMGLWGQEMMLPIKALISIYLENFKIDLTLKINFQIKKITSSLKVDKFLEAATPSEIICTIKKSIYLVSWYKQELSFYGT